MCVDVGGWVGGVPGQCVLVWVGGWSTRSVCVDVGGWVEYQITEGGTGRHTGTIQIHLLGKWGGGGGC